MKYVKRSIVIEEEQDRWLKKARKEKGFNFSNFVQRAVRDLMMEKEII